MHMKFSGFINLFSLLVSAIFIFSCVGFKEAYENRVCWDGNSAVPVQCDEVFINLKCPDNLKSLSGPVMPANKKIVIKPVGGFSAPKVGELFSHHGSIPIFVIGGSPWNTLYDDVAYILQQLGYEVRDKGDGSESVIEADMKLLDVRSNSGGWFDLKGTTQATASFRVVLLHNTDKDSWTAEFTGKHQIKVSYFLLSDAEKTLGEAYCRALENFAYTVRTQKLHNMVR